MILVVDDDLGIRTSLSMMLKRAHHEVKAVASPREAMAVVREEEPRLIMLDMNFSLSTSGDEGLTLLRQIKLFRPTVPIILMTAWGSIQLAVKGMRAGAFDFVTKPWNNVALMERIEVALSSELRGLASGSYQKERKKDGSTRPGVAPRAEGEKPGVSDIVGKSAALRQVLDTVSRVASTNAPVLILGESGTGKELIAEALHRQSHRAKEHFVKVNLGGMSQSLFESEMFGYKKGAFTGAVADRMGRFELADRGTIFLDEIGDLDLSSQVKLLRVLQDQTFEPLGDSRAKQVNVRVVCATNADLPRMIAEGTFREDLFYRVNLITVHLPALRDRREDIPLLARHFIRLRCQADHLPDTRLSADAESYLQRLDYPGNIRQLKNIVERTLLMSGKETLTKEDFQRFAQLGTERFAQPKAREDNALRKESPTLEEHEREAIQRAMQEYGGKISRVAEALGLSRQAVYRRLEKYGLSPTKDA